MHAFIKPPVQIFKIIIKLNLAEIFLILFEFSFAELFQNCRQLVYAKKAWNISGDLFPHFKNFLRIKNVFFSFIGAVLIKSADFWPYKEKLQEIFKESSNMFLCWENNSFLSKILSLTPHEVFKQSQWNVLISIKKMWSSNFPVPRKF